MVTILKASQTKDGFNRIKELVNNLNLLNDPSAEIEATNIEYVTPLMVLPLAIRLSELQKESNYNIKISNKLKEIYFPAGTDFQNFKIINNDIMPICFGILVGNDINPEFLINSIIERYGNFVIEHLKTNNENFDNYLSSLKYFLSEISDNIYEHSEASQFWIQTRFWPNRRELELCIVDNGIGIKQCYDKRGFGTLSHVDALAQAVRGVSSKKVGRGYGLGTNIRMFCSEDFKGEFTVITGNACYYKNHNEPSSIGIIPYHWKGLILDIKVKTPDHKVNYLKYLEN